MSRFASPDATARLDLGPCQCDGNPHESDYVIYRTRLGYAAILEVVELNDTSASVAKRRLIELGVVEWNLLRDGAVAPIDAESVGSLDLVTAEAIFNAVNVALAEPTLPNGSGARSQASSRASASRRQGPTRTLTTR